MAERQPSSIIHIRRVRWPVIVNRGLPHLYEMATLRHSGSLSSHSPTLPNPWIEGRFGRFARLEEEMGTFNFRL
jgi:hypothetical protein